MQLPTDVLLFDQYGHRAEIIFRPCGGIWRLRDFYEVLVACRCLPVVGLVGVSPSSAHEGGFVLPRSEAGWRAMLKAGVASPRLPLNELTSIQRNAVSGQFCFGHSCGALPWTPPLTPQCSGANEVPLEDAWIDAMPQDPNFESDSLSGIAAEEERVVRLWARGHVEDRHLWALLQALESCNHTVQQSVGFTISSSGLCVTGSQARAVRHKHGNGSTAFGAICAQASQAERGRKIRPRAMLGDDRSSKHRPSPPLAAILPLTLADTTSLLAGKVESSLQNTLTDLVQKPVAEVKDLPDL